MPEENNVGLLIQRARQRKHMTQERLADELGVSRHAVIYWEQGKHFPSRYAGAIEAALDITLPAPEQAAS